MDRRAALRTLAAAVPVWVAGCGSNLPSATGPRRPPASDSPPPSGDTVVEVVDVDVEEAPDGDVRVVATVRNRGGQATTREVVARATLDGEERVRSTRVDLAANGEREVAFDFDVGYAAFVDGDGSVSVETR
ncbi:MAG: hypothetical protein ABEH47_00495 [Haloferacaceae archaeon]